MRSETRNVISHRLTSVRVISNEQLRTKLTEEEKN